MLNKFLIFVLIIQPSRLQVFGNSPEKLMEKVCLMNDINLGKLNGELRHGKATLNWKTYEPAGAVTFIVERSDNGGSFVQLATILGSSSLDGINHQYRDESPLPTGFYRIKLSQPDGDDSYSNIIRITGISEMPVVNITPVPFNEMITVQIASKITEQFFIKLTDYKGKVLSSKELTAEKGNNAVVFDDGISFLYPAEYFIEVTGNNFSYRQKVYKK